MNWTKHRSLIQESQKDWVTFWEHVLKAAKMDWSAEGKLLLNPTPNARPDVSVRWDEEDTFDASETFSPIFAGEADRDAVFGDGELPKTEGVTEDRSEAKPKKKGWFG